MKEEFETGMKNIPTLDSPAPPQAPTQPVSSGFTPVNSGGFTPVNAAPATFTPVSINRRDREENNNFTPTRRPFDSPLGSAKNTPEYRPSALSSAPVVNGFTSNPMLKRQLSHDSLDSREKGSSQPDDSDNGGRRSKRLKKGTWMETPSTALNRSMLELSFRGARWCQGLIHCITPIFFILFLDCDWRS